MRKVALEAWECQSKDKWVVDLKDGFRMKNLEVGCSARCVRGTKTNYGKVKRWYSGLED